ncbi:IS701 family transposase [Nocardia sp. NPDC004573]
MLAPDSATARGSPFPQVRMWCFDPDSGTAGRTGNCQIGVFLAYASARGHALVDRELYLPESWTEDRSRCRAAGIPDAVEFATKPRLVIAMLARTLAAKVPFGWFTADEAYGAVKYLRFWLEQHHIAHVLATRRNDTLVTTGWTQARADELVAALPARAWRRISAGAGAHGPRDYDWARVPIRVLWEPRARTLATGTTQHLQPCRVAYYVCYGPRRSTIADLAWIAGARWRIEECFQQAKNEAGLDHYQVRSWRAWYAHITLSMLAPAWLTESKAVAIKGESATAIKT